MHKRLLAFLIALGGLASASPLTQDAPARDWTDDIKDALVVYDNQDAFVQKVRLTAVMQYQMGVVQPNGSNGQHLRQGASPYNDEFRRAWAGVHVDFASGTHLFAETRLGGLPLRRSYPDGASRRDYTYFSLIYLVLSQEVPGVKGLTFSAGKLQPFVGAENLIPSAQLKCIERSMIIGQYGFDSNWGVELTYEPNEADTFFFQLLANDAAHYMKANEHPDAYRDGRGFKGEFGWEDKCFAVAYAAHKFGMTESGYHEVSAQYAHDFNNAYHGKRPAGANCFGLGVKDVVSLGYNYKHDRLSVLSNLIMNFETMGGQGSNNVGFVVRPVYALSPHVDLVCRYSAMRGDGACRLGGDCYTCSQTTADAWVDSLHAFYLGANFYASAKDPDAVKFMLGAEYITARKNGADCYNGWTYSCSFRSYF